MFFSKACSCKNLFIVLSRMRDFICPARSPVRKAKDDVTQLIIYIADYERGGAPACMWLQLLFR